MRNRRLIIIFSVLLFVTVLVLSGSIIFSVKTVVANCLNHTSFYNQSDTVALNAAIVENTPLKGKNVLFIDDKEIKSHIEQRVPTIKVIDVERVFPNAVRIHYIKMFSYFETKIDNTYYEFLCNGKVVNVSPSKSENLRINIIADLTKTYQVGDYILGGFLEEAATAFERLGLSYESAAVFFDFIDLVSQEGVIFVGLRNSNTVFRIFGTENFLEKLRLAYSFYCTDGLYDPAIHTMITIVDGTGYANDERYVP